MRKVVKIVGLGHVEGVSKKTNMPYSFYQAHMTYEDGKVDGLACCSLVIPDEIVSQVIVGSSAVVYTHFANGREYLTGYYPDGYHPLLEEE